MVKYKLVNWPDIQYYMEHPRYNECYCGCSIGNLKEEVWFVSEDIWVNTSDYDIKG